MGASADEKAVPVKVGPAETPAPPNAHVVLEQRSPRNAEKAEKAGAGSWNRGDRGGCANMNTGENTKAKSTSSTSTASIHNKKCLSPPRPRTKASCKPSPARSAAAVILATLLGGQPQEQEQEQGGAGEEPEQEGGEEEEKKKRERQGRVPQQEQVLTECPRNRRDVRSAESTSSVAEAALAHQVGSERLSGSTSGEKETHAQQPPRLGAQPWLHGPQPQQGNVERLVDGAEVAQQQSGGKAEAAALGPGLRGLRGAGASRMPDRSERSRWGQEVGDAHPHPDSESLCFTIGDENGATTYSRHGSADVRKASPTAAAAAKDKGGAGQAKDRGRVATSAIQPALLQPRSPSVSLRRSPLRSSQRSPNDIGDNANHGAHQSGRHAQECGQGDSECSSVDRVVSASGSCNGDRMPHSDGGRLGARKRSRVQVAAGAGVGAWTPSPKGVATNVSGRSKSSSRKAHSGGTGNSHGGEKRALLPQSEKGLDGATGESRVCPGGGASDGGADAAGADAADAAAGTRLLSSQESVGVGAGLGPGSDLGCSYSRKDKSLGLLCGRFVQVYGQSQHFRDRVAGNDNAPGDNKLNAQGPSCKVEEEGMIELDRAAGELGVARRRIYDVINILESVCVVTRARKNTYRWHGKKNLLLTLRQLQRTATFVFPEEVAKNDMAECLKEAKLIGSAVGSLGGPRADGTKEKSLGGLCRRFVQLFLVGNEVVSVGEAAEKLSDAADVAKATVVFKTRARRLYDIANALAALGLVEKVRSPDSCKPNFRWIGIPVRTLPLLDLSQSHDAGLSLSLTNPGCTGQASPPGEHLLSEKGIPGFTSPSTESSAFSSASAGRSAFSVESGDAGGIAAAAPAGAPVAAGGMPGLPREVLGVETPTYKRRGIGAGSTPLGMATGDAYGNEGFGDTGEAWTPLAAVTDRGIEAGSSRSRRGRPERFAFDGASPPSTVVSTRWVSSPDTPSAVTKTTYSGSKRAKVNGTSSADTANTSASMAGFSSNLSVASDMPSVASDITSEQGSPVDPRKVMREFPEPDSCKASSSDRGSRKRCRSGAHATDSDNDDDGWIADHAGIETAFSPPPGSRQSSKLSSTVVTAKVSVARDDTHTPGTDARFAQPPNRKRSRIRQTEPTQPGAESSFRSLLSPNTLPTSGRAVAQAMDNPREIDSAGRKYRAPAGLDDLGARSGHTRDTEEGGDRQDRTDNVVEGDAGVEERVEEREGRDQGYRDDGGASLRCSRGAVAVTPQESSLSPPDPSLIRECLDEYLETYTEQWKSWRDGETADFHFQPPAFLSPGPGQALGHLFSPISFKRNCGSSNRSGSAESVRGSRTSCDDRTDAPRSGAKHGLHDVRMRTGSAEEAGVEEGTEKGAEADPSAISGMGSIGQPVSDVGQVPTTPALRSSSITSSSRSGGTETNSVGKEGAWRFETADFGATTMSMIGLGRE